MDRFTVDAAAAFLRIIIDETHQPKLRPTTQTLRQLGSRVPGAIDQQMGTATLTDSVEMTAQPKASARARPPGQQQHQNGLQQTNAARRPHALAVEIEDDSRVTHAINRDRL